MPSTLILIIGQLAIACIFADSSTRAHGRLLPWSDYWSSSLAVAADLRTPPTREDPILEVTGRKHKRS